MIAPAMASAMMASKMFRRVKQYAVAFSFGMRGGLVVWITMVFGVVGVVGSTFVSTSAIIAFIVCREILCG